MNTITAVRASDLILLNHHPDLARQPEAKPGLIDSANRAMALAWNVFRTLELIAPPFWLRRFRARLDVLTSLEPVDRSLSVRLWAVLPPAERGHREAVCVDALIDTDTAVYGAMTLAGSDVEFRDSTLPRPDPILRMIDAGIIQDCAESNSLTDLERFAARRTRRWLDSLGIHPPDS